MLRQHKPSFIHLRSRGMIFGTPCRRSFPWRRSRPTGFSSGPWKWQAHRASGTSRRSHPSWACLQGKLMNSIVPRMIFLMFRQPPALTDYRNIRNMHFKNQRWLDSKKNQEWWTVIPWESSHLYWWLEFPKTGIEPPLPRWECKRLKGCVFSPSFLLPVLGGPKEARKCNLSIASIPVCLLTTQFETSNETDPSSWWRVCLRSRGRGGCERLWPGSSCCGRASLASGTLKKLKTSLLDFKKLRCITTIELSRNISNQKKDENLFKCCWMKNHFVDLPCRDGYSPGKLGDSRIPRPSFV